MIDSYVSPGGSDSNDGTATHPVLTIQKGADLLVDANGNPGSGIVHIADGTYACGATVMYYRQVVFQGNDSSPWEVVISTASGVTAFSAQDHCIMIVRGMELHTPSGIGIAARQFAIVDYTNIRWAQASIHISANEMSKINGGGSEWILNGCTYHGAANGQSQLNLGCSTWVNEQQSFSSYIWLNGSSIAILSGSGFSGSGATTTTGSRGRIGNWGSAVYTNGITVPGNSDYDTSAGGGQVF